MKNYVYIKINRFRSQKKKVLIIANIFSRNTSDAKIRTLSFDCVGRSISYDSYPTSKQQQIELISVPL